MDRYSRHVWGQSTGRGTPKLFLAMWFSGKRHPQTASRMTHVWNRHWTGTDGRVGWRALALLLGWGLLMGGGLQPVPAAAQSADRDEGAADEGGLVERYREARLRTLARRQLRQQGRLPPYPLEMLPTPNDSLAPTDPSRIDRASEESSFPLETVRAVRRLETDWFQDRFGETDWAFLGDTPGHTFLDTSRTPDLRARLQGKFGAPTRTLADAPLEKPPKTPIQFEYWFVVNDSIPVQVMDPDGPKGRGLIVAVERSYREQLPALRDTLLVPLRREDRTPHVDYYYDERRERWYRTGFDGQSFFLKQIPGTDVVPGQRAYLDTTQTTESASRPDERSP